MSTPLLAIDGLTAQYHGIKALRGIDLTVPAGGITAVIGPNGAGKSTLLNVISGFVRPSAGTLRFDGRELAGRKPYAIARGGVLQVPEGRRILAPLSVEENLQLGQLARGGRAESDAASAWTLERVYQLFPILRDKRQQAGGALSGGQQQMLAIGRALMAKPRLLMLDEPSLGLAPVIVNEVFAALTRLNQEGLTILLVEQNARRALELADTAYVFDRGEVVQHGPSSALRNDARIIEHYLGADLRASVPSAGIAP